MLLLNRFVPIVATIFIALLFEIFVLYYANILIIVPLIILILIVSLWQLRGRKFFDRDLWNFFITPFLLLSGAFLFILFLENSFIKQGVIIISGLLLLLFLNNIFLYLFQPLRYQAYSLENISSYLNLIALWFWFTSLFGLIILLDAPVWILTVFASLITAVFYYSACWINKFDIKKIWPYIIILAFIIAEIFLAVSFLPTSFYVNGLLTAVFYYILAGLGRMHILGNLDRKIFLKYTIFGSLIILAVFLTARWT